MLRVIEANQALHLPPCGQARGWQLWGLASRQIRLFTPVSLVWAGLKFGIYGDAGFKTCASFPGNLYHEQVDAETFAAWGVDYLKYDNCWTPPPSEITIEQKFSRMRDALNATGRPILFSTSEWGLSSIWTYGHTVGHGGFLPSQFGFPSGA